MLEYIKKDLTSYLTQYPNESSDLLKLRDQLEHADHTIFERSNMLGHITSSALLLTPECDKALLIHHGTYNTWIAPGGHVDDPTQLLLDSAYREILEETGFEINNKTVKLDRTLLLDIDTHHIAPNTKKNEGAHWHHDFLYLVYTSVADLELIPQLSEVKSAKWESIDNLRTLIDPRYTKICKKLDTILGLNFEAPSNISLEIGKILSLHNYIYELNDKIAEYNKTLRDLRIKESFFDIDTEDRDIISSNYHDISTTKDAFLLILEDVTTNKKRLYESFCESYPNYQHVLNHTLNASIKDNLLSVVTTF